LLRKCLSTGQSEEELLLDELEELLELLGVFELLEVDGVGVLLVDGLVLGVLVELVLELESEPPELLRESLR
jgi:hypothetical protein